jgi:hypothetical protein
MENKPFLCSDFFKSHSNSSMWNRVMERLNVQCLKQDSEDVFRIQYSSVILNYCVFKTHHVSETGFCLRVQVKPTQLGPIDIVSPCLRRQNPVAETSCFKIKTGRWIISRNIKLLPKISITIILKLVINAMKLLNLLKNAPHPVRSEH